MAENILHSVEKVNKGFEVVMQSSILLKGNLRLLNVYLRNLHEEEIQGKNIEDLDKILQRKHEYCQNLQEVTILCDELKNHLDKLDITSYSARDNKGRKNLSACDSGIDSIVSQDLEGHRVSVGPHTQDSSAHTHPESITIHEDSREAVEDTEC